MIDFKAIEIQDKSWIDPLLAAADMPGCQHNFTNLFAWAEIYQYRVAQVADYLVVKGELNKTPYYFYPAGQGDPQPALEAMRRDAADGDHDFFLVGLSIEDIAVLNRLFPSSFEYTENRDAFDYVYLLDKLVSLSGDKYRAKRNHVNHFKKHNDWTFEEISPANLAECWEMNMEWCKLHGCKEDAHLANETCAVRRCFEHFSELGLEGGLLRVDGRVVAYTMGSPLNSDTYDTHIEKAFEAIQGAYQMINQQFAMSIQQRHPQTVYVNREEDMGQEGLRKAKKSYHPVRMEKKYSGLFIQRP